MNAKHALLYGLNASLRQGRTIVLLYLAALVVGLFLLAPLLPILAGALGDSLAGAGIEARIDVAVLGDIMLANAGAVRWFHRYASLVVLLYLLLATALAGGVLHSLLAPRTDRGRWLAHFLEGCGRFLPRFLRLLLLHLPFLVLLAGANRGANLLIRALFEDGTHAVAAALTMWGKQAVLLVLFLWLAAAFDYARIDIALHDRRSVMRSLGTGLRFTLTNPFSVLTVRLTLAAATAILFALYAGVSKWLLPEAAVVSMLMVQQGTILAQRTLAVVQVAAELNLFRGREMSEDARLLSRLTSPAAARNALCLLIAPVAAIGAMAAMTSWATPAMAAAPLSDRVVSYEIRAELVPGERTIVGEERVRYRNASDRPLTALWFHLYPNAFRHSDTVYMRESVQGGDRIAKDEAIRRGTWGYLQVESITIDGGPDLAAAADLRETLMEVPLPEPLAPGDSVTLLLRWRTRLPRTIARMGYRGAHYDVMQWFPKVAGLVDGVWNAHDFHSDSEFYSDFGTYDVTLSVPAGFVVEATGIRVEEETDPETGNRLLRYHADDVHDFAWVADPHMLRAAETYRGVEVVFLHQPYHRHHVERILAAVRSSLDFYGDHLMEYPWPRLVVDDLPMGLSGGMEYPMFFTVTLHWAQPRWVRSPEGVTIHEFGHQYWYGILASNEFEAPWLDEGINSYVTNLVEEEHWGSPDTAPTQTAMFRYAAARLLNGGIGLALGPIRIGIEDFLGFRASPFAQSGTRLLPLRFNPEAVQLDGFPDPNLLDGRAAYLPVAGTDPLDRRSWEFLPGSYGALVYDKTYLVMKTLERVLGRDTVLAGLKLYVDRHRFRHPTGADLEAALEEAAGEDLSIWFDQLLHGDGTFDYSIRSAGSTPIRDPHGYPPQDSVGTPAGALSEPGEGDDDGEAGFRSEVILYRDGEVRLPVEVLLRFEDGSEIRETWDGRDRWKRLTYEFPARLVSAQVDPEYRLVLDLDPTNNSWTAEPNTRGVAKIAAILLFWFENLLQITSLIS